MILTYICADLIKYLNQPEEVAIQSISYTKILGYLIIPVMLFQTYKLMLTLRFNYKSKHPILF